jgi:hypothetical protein
MPEPAPRATPLYAQPGCLVLRDHTLGAGPRLLDQQPEPQRQQDQHEYDRQYRWSPTLRGFQQRPTRRRRDAGLSGRMATPVANQRLVGDLSTAMCANHVVCASRGSRPCEPAAAAGRIWGLRSSLFRLGGNRVE